MKTKFNTKSLVLLGMLTALVMVFSFTPIGSIPIGDLSITLNIIPIAIAAVALGPVGGAVIGAVFGIFSFLQCFGIGIPSGLGAICLEISPILTFLQRFVPRVLDGLLVGFIFRFVSSKFNVHTASFVTGFFAAFLNTAFFMSALVLLFRNSDYMVESMAGRSAIAYILASVGINAVFEMVASTVITGAVGLALYKAKFIQLPQEQTA